jgi:polysaccharide export outer membrane protein
MRLHALLLNLLIAGCASVTQSSVPVSPTTVAVSTVDRNLYQLGSGDRIRIEIFGEPDLMTESLLEVTGTINFPLLGRIQAAGLTLKELEQSLAAKLKQGYLKNPNVRASIIQFRPIYVIGQVHHAGSYPYIEGLSVEKAIALAGGMTAIASSRKIYVLREKNSQNQREHAQLETPIFPGDTIVVEESLF